MKNIKEWEDWFDSRFKQLFKVFMKSNNIPSIKVATVITVGTGVADVQLPNDTTNTIPNIKIGKNVTVAPGDTVYLLCLNGDIGNSYILTNSSMA